MWTKEIDSVPWVAIINYNTEYADLNEASVPEFIPLQWKCRSPGEKGQGPT